MIFCRFWRNGEVIFSIRRSEIDQLEDDNWKRLSLIIPRKEEEGMYSWKQIEVVMVVVVTVLAVIFLSRIESKKSIK